MESDLSNTKSPVLKQVYHLFITCYFGDTATVLRQD